MEVRLEVNGLSYRHRDGVIEMRKTNILNQIHKG